MQDIHRSGTQKCNLNCKTGFDGYHDTSIHIYMCQSAFWDWIVSNSSRSVFSFAIGTLNARHTQKWDTDM